MLEAHMQEYIHRPNHNHRLIVFERGEKTHKKGGLNCVDDLNLFFS